METLFTEPLLKLQGNFVYGEDVHPNTVFPKD